MNNRKISLLTTTVGLVVAITFAEPALARASQTSIRPPDNLYTCAWIAAHEEAAAQARVSCDPLSVAAAVGNALTLDPTIERPDSIDATGCQYVPANGARVGPGVFAWSTYEYANHWQWYPNYGPPVNYTAYVQRQNGTNVVSSPFYDMFLHEFNVGANTDRWGAQNHTNPAQSWYVCYSVT